MNLHIISTSTPVKKAFEAYFNHRKGETKIDAERPADIIFFDHVPPVTDLIQAHKTYPFAVILLGVRGKEPVPCAPFAVQKIQIPVRLEHLAHILGTLPATHTLRIQTLTLYPQQRKMITDDQRLLMLTEKEVHLLVYLHQNQGIPLSKETLLQKVWGYHKDTTTHTLETHIYKLKQKLNAISAPNIIQLTEKGYNLIL